MTAQFWALECVENPSSETIYHHFSIDGTEVGGAENGSYIFVILVDGFKTYLSNWTIPPGRGENK